MAFQANFPARCGRCLRPIRKGDLIVRLEVPSQLPIPERYNYDKQRTEGGGYRLLKYGHAECPEVSNERAG